MSALTIRHTHLDGTLLEGSSKGDGVLDIVKRHGFRWFPSIAAIGIRQSRDHVAKRHLINGAADALRAAGHEVTVEIDDTPRIRAEVLADQAVRLDDRADALQAKAARRAGEAEALWAYSDRLVEHIPFGQPILVGHHSERGHRRTLERAQNAAFAAVARGAEARATQRRADVVGVTARVAETPTAALRRIERLEAELRGIDRDLNGHTRRHLNGNGDPVYVFKHEGAEVGSDWHASLTARREQIGLQLEHDRATVAAAVESGGITVYDRTTLHVGDRVTTSRRADARWYEVRKVNQKTVSVPSGYSWLDKIPMTEIRQVDCPHGAEEG